MSRVGPKRLIRWGVGLILGSALAFAAFAGWSFQELRRPYAGWSGAFTAVEIPPGTNARGVIALLCDAGVLENEWLSATYLALNGGGAALQAGEYRFDIPLSPLDVLARVRSGEVLLHEVTIPEGLDLEQVAALLAEQGFADKATLLDAFSAPAALAAIDPAPANLEGLLFPDTYRFSRDVSAERIARTLVEHFSAVTGADYPARAKRVGLSVLEAVTLASLIEKETSIGAERRRISGVFHNRLKKRILLQCDPTVLYALKRDGKPVRKLYTKHLEHDSPYNTYRYAGLPPGPIANPGAASLDAAVDPLESNELYFVAKPGGGHAFSENLAQHNRAVSRWRAYLRSSR